jgi:UDP-N-acetyl-D-galactosamine dehydrogenase
LHEYGLEIVTVPDTAEYDLIVLAVPHRELVEDFGRFAQVLAPGGGIVDLKNALAGSQHIPSGSKLWTM